MTYKKCVPAFEMILNEEPERAIWLLLPRLMAAMLLPRLRGCRPAACPGFRLGAAGLLDLISAGINRGLAVCCAPWRFANRYCGGDKYADHRWNRQQKSSWKGRFSSFGYVAARGSHC